MLTNSEILTEYGKCISNPVYAIETYIQTKDLTQGGFVPFKLFPRQKEIVWAYEKHRYNLVTKPRQAGISTTTQAYMAIKSAFSDPDSPETILIIANKLKLAQKFVRGIKDYLLQLPRWVWGPEYYGTEEKEGKSIFLSDSKIELKLPNGTEIIAVATSEDALRGYTPTYLVFDEAAFIDNGAAVYAAAMSSCATGGRVMLISTPNGMDPLYHKTYEQSKIGKNNYNICEMRWYEDPRYNKDLRWIKKDKDGVVSESIEEVEFIVDNYQKMLDAGYKATSSWYEDMCMTLNNNARKIAQELDVSFLGSGGNVIADEDIMFHEKNNVEDPVWTTGTEGEFWMWEKPIEGHQYILGCLTPGEKVLTDKGLMNIEEVSLEDKLVSEDGEYVDIINTQIYPVVDEPIFEVKMANNYRTTTFTKEHPILVSDVDCVNVLTSDFKYVRMGEVKVGDWVKLPNIYKKNIEGIFNNKWLPNDSTLEIKDFWWFIGTWLGKGSLGIDDDVILTFNSDDYYLNKCVDVVMNVFNEVPIINANVHKVKIVFKNETLYNFLANYFGHDGDKTISEWVKFIPNKFKQELISGYFNISGSWNKELNGNKFTSSIIFNGNLEVLEGVQDILFSLSIISSLESHNDEFILSLDNNNSLMLINLINKVNDPKVNKYDVSEFLNDESDFKTCIFDEDENYIYLKIDNINTSKYTGNVYNFECDTHTFMCHRITTHNCDVSRGDGEDASTIVILDFTTMEQVFEFQGKIQPDLLAEIVYEYGNLYNAYTVVDIAGGMGVSTVLKLIELDYKHLHYDDGRAKILNSKKNELESYSKDNKMPGFNANGVRLPMIAHLEYMIRANAVKIKSRRMTSEMKTFIYKNGRPDHAEGFHDDLLMALAMPLWVLEHSFKKLKKLKKQSKAILQGWTVGGSSNSTNNNDNNGNGFVSSKNRNKKTTGKPNFNHNVSKNMQDPRGDYLWLFSGTK